MLFTFEDNTNTKMNICYWRCISTEWDSSKVGNLYNLKIPLFSLKT